MADVAQLVRAPGCGSGGRGFETHHSPQDLKRDCIRSLFVYYEADLQELDESDIELHVRIMGMTILGTCLPMWEESIAGEWRQS